MKPIPLSALMEARWAKLYAGLEDTRGLWRSGRVVLYLPLVGLFRLLPRRAASTVGRWLGGAAYWALTRYRNRSIENIRHAFPENGESWARTVARESFGVLGCCVAEVAGLGRKKRGAGVCVSSVSGWAGIERGLEGGCGAVLVSAHMGCWELLPAYLASKGLRTALVVEPQAGVLETSFLRGARRRLGVAEIVPSLAMLRGALTVLSEGGVVVCPLDRDCGERGYQGMLLGRPIKLSSLPVRLAALSGSVILAAHAARTKYGNDLVFGRPAVVERAADFGRRTAALAGVLEGWIRERPEQWVWLKTH
jgi:KDO2-lipid IV(A) lauroyltransferase